MKHLVVTILPNKYLLEPNNPRRKNFYLEIQSAVLKRSRIQYFYSEVLSRSLAKFLTKSSTITTYNEIQTKFERYVLIGGKVWKHTKTGFLILGML